jgi:S1-C subfamily serine protease
MNRQKELFWLIFVFSAVLIVIFFIRTSRETLRYSMRERTKNLSVGVYSIDTKNVNGNVLLLEGASYGTGVVFWRDGYILSAAHIIKTNVPQTILIETNNKSANNLFEGEILAVDTKNDLAAFKIKTGFPSEIPLGDSQFEPWEKVYSYNCLHGACGTYTEGNFITYGKNVTAFGEADNLIFFDMFIAGGASGSGIFDENGNLVSLTQSGLSLTIQFPPATLGPDIRTIHHFLAINKLPHRHHSSF